MTGWTISKISTSFHHALVALVIRQSAMENSDGQLRYSRKTRGPAVAPLRCSRVKYWHGQQLARLTSQITFRVYMYWSKVSVRLDAASNITMTEDIYTDAIEGAT